MMKSTPVELSELGSSRSLLDAAPDAMVLVDSHGEIVFANRQTSAAFGYSEEELAGMPVEVLIPERYRPDHQRHRSDYFASPHVRPMGIDRDLFGLRKDGSEFPVDISLAPLEEGRFAWAVIRDIGLHQRLSRARAVSEKLIADAPALILVLDPEGRILEMNPCTERTLGCVSGDVVGWNWFDNFLPERDRAGIQALFGEVVNRLGRVTHTNSVLTSDGERQIEWDAQVLKDEQSQILGLLNVGHDVTERLAREHELRRFDERLVESSRHKDEFLAKLAHELANPLAPIRSGVDLMKRDLQPDVATRLQPMMARQLVHLERLVDDLRDISRIGRGDLFLKASPMNLNEAILDGIEQVSAIIREGEHELFSNLSADPLMVDGDLDRLTQVVANLVGNAAKYTDPGGTVSVGSEADHGEAVVRVRDTGHGIPPEQMDQLFDLFRQGFQHQRLAGRGGLGIGLALSRQLIGMHGGSIEARSEGPGRGSEFIVRLPLVDE